MSQKVESKAQEKQEKSENKMEHKVFRFHLVDSETKASKGQNFGYIKGYASTFGNKDRGGDIVMRGAFVKSIEEYRRQGKIIPMCYQHSMMDMIGGFDPIKMREDEKGLYVEGEINLDVGRGKDAYALMKQGVIDSMSIGYTSEDSDLEGSGEEIVRKLKELKLWEISAVGIPMNAEARITDVKAEKTGDSVSINEFIGIISNRDMPLNEKKGLVAQILRNNVLSNNAANYVMSFMFKISDKKEVESSEDKSIAEATAILKALLIDSKQDVENKKLLQAKKELESLLKK
jgi:HK97 family phage prohead protease